MSIFDRFLWFFRVWSNFLHTDGKILRRFYWQPIRSGVFIRFIAKLTRSGSFTGDPSIPLFSYDCTNWYRKRYSSHWEKS